MLRFRILPSSKEYQRQRLVVILEEKEHPHKHTQTHQHKHKYIHIYMHTLSHAPVCVAGDEIRPRRYKHDMGLEFFQQLPHAYKKKKKKGWNDC